MKRRIHQNVWGNWNAYIGRNRFMEFGTNQAGAEKWLETGDIEEYVKPEKFTIQEYCKKKC